MNKFDDLVKELNDLKIHQTSIDWAECLPDEIWEKHFKDNFKELESELDVDKHRHYELSTSVIKIYDRILGIHRISDVFSEMSMVEDCYHHLEFFEMKEQQTITYVSM